MLTPEQLSAVKSGAHLHLFADEVEVVVMRADVYEQLKKPPYDDSEWTAEEMQALTQFSMDDADAADSIP